LQEQWRPESETPDVAGVAEAVAPSIWSRVWATVNEFGANAARSGGAP
jgi:hypothetical protein